MATSRMMNKWQGSSAWQLQPNEVIRKQDVNWTPSFYASKQTPNNGQKKWNAKYPTNDNCPPFGSPLYLLNDNYPPCTNLPTPNAAVCVNNHPVLRDDNAA
jgi:hypothetical protein